MSSPSSGSNEAPKLRQQILHVYQFRLCPPRRSLRSKIDSFMSSTIANCIIFSALCGIPAVFGLVGAYGSAGLILMIADWLAREGVEVKIKSYEFGWRTAMLGCIQLFSESKVTRWMDSIVVSHP
ncbi:hypothetical protein PENFLA_c024G02015 [Penicillium flavigenum]|uniref:Uncharacterized protein n=1 Tax=Penicillium flavigenum TaxID=254877 RepID=A0A1V6STN0_9EURO|nr:hypothetical protein PENFLA_c024G02015 [Penicillium flavigenum]